MEEGWHGRILIHGHNVVYDIYVVLNCCLSLQVNLILYIHV